MCRVPVLPSILRFSNNYIFYIFLNNTCTIYYILYLYEKISIYYIFISLIETGLCVSPWLFNVYMDGEVPDVNAGVQGKGLELLSVKGGMFEINQLSIVLPNIVV